MKTYLLYNFFLFVLVVSTLFQTSNASAQINEIYTNYDGFWSSSSTSINSLNPDDSHELLGFTYNGTTYSTGINDSKLSANGISFTSLVIRALPIAELPTAGGGSYFVGLGERFDGIANGVDASSSLPFNTITTVNEPPSFLTDGVQGLDLGTCLANIPNGTEARFNLSVAGIDVSQIGGDPDILVSQIASPSGGGDELEFVDSMGNTVGNIFSINFNSEPVVANWDVDFYRFNSTQPSSGFVNTTRALRFRAADLSDFGITPANVGDAVALLYRPSGSSDPAFIAFNEPSIAVATQLAIVNPNPPTQQNCDGTLTPGFFDVQLQDQAGNPVQQAGLEIIATLESGPGSLLGTTSQITNSSGVAEFDDLEFDVGGNHIIKFSFAGLDDALSSVIIDATGCSTITWTGSSNSDWSDTSNWLPNEIPDGNNDVIIPNGAPNYPILDQDAGVRDLDMGSNASIVLNGFLLALNGSLTDVDLGASIDASAPNSELYMSASTIQDIPANFIEEDVSNFTIENSSGVILNSVMNISEVLLVKEGNLDTNDFISLTCSFLPTRKTALIGPLDGTISGELTVEQCFPGRRAFRLVTSSVTTSTSIKLNWQENPSSFTDDPNPGHGTHITGVEPGSTNATIAQDGNNGFDYNPSGNPSLFSFNNAGQSWNAVLNTNATTLTAGEAYRLMIRGNRSIDITSNAATPSNSKLHSTGNIVKGPINYNFPLASGEVGFVGNPFHSMVDMQSILSNATNLSQSFVVWDPNLGGTPVVGQSGGRGAFVTVNATINTSNNSTSEMNKYLQPYQAAFVLVTGSSPSLTFEETDKVTDQEQLNVFRNTSQTQHINMLLFDQQSYTNNNTADDGLSIYFSPDASNEVNSSDAPKFLNLDENLARQEGDQLLSIENRALPEANEVLNLHLSQYRTTNYVFEIELGDFPDNEVYLYDNYTDTEVLLNQNTITSHPFTVDQTIDGSVDQNRFDIRFQPQTSLSSEDFNLAQISVYPNPVENQLKVKVPRQIKLNQVNLFNMLGQKLLSSQRSTIQLNQLTSGVYLVEIQTDQGTLTQKVIKK